LGRPSHLVATIIIFMAVCVPLSTVTASTKSICPTTATTTEISIQINASSLTSNSAKPTITGTACGTKTVKLTLFKEGTTKTYYKKTNIRVKNDRWRVKISKKLADGVYDIKVTGTKGEARRVTASGQLVVGKKSKESKNSAKSATTLAIGSVPLLFGGTARAGANVPVSYLQITNIGKETANLKGFWVKQNGSASTQSVIGLTVIDGSGGSKGAIGGTEGSTPFKNGLAFVPTDSIFAPGQMRVFTIKAVMSSNVSAHLGKQLNIAVTSVDTTASPKGPFPIPGATWTIGN